MTDLGIRRVKELPQQYLLLTDSQAIQANLEYIFGERWHELKDVYGAIFVWGENGDVVHCFATETNVPKNETLLDQLR